MAKVVQLLSVVVFVAFVGTAGVHAQTHMGQQPSSHVTLQSVGTLGGCTGSELDFDRVLPDGTSGGIFRVPARQVLVVTDVDWQYAHPDGAAAAGTIQIFRLFIENLANSSISRRAFESTITLNSAGEGGISENMTSGFIVSSMARICPDVFPGNDIGIQHIMVRGYLTSDR